MSTIRHYFISDSLDDLEHVEEELEERGIATAQIHVLSLDDTDVENHHHLHAVTSMMKKDVIRSGLLGALIGAVGALLVLGITYLAGWASTPAGWIPFVFLAIIVFGFSTWEGGFLGIQRPNAHFARFEGVLAEGKHVFFVDTPAAEEGVLEQVVANHPTLELAGTERGTPKWISDGEKRVPAFLRETMP